MPGYRRARINDAMQAEMSFILREVKDPRLASAMITVTACDVTPDLKFAKIYFSYMQGEEKEIIRGLRAASPFMRRQLAERLNLRITPELTFVRDVSIEHGAHIASLLHQIEQKKPAPAKEDNDDSANA